MGNETTSTSRRRFHKESPGLAGGESLVGTLAVPRAVHAGVGETLRVGLIGCGSRGTSAAQNALNASPANVLVALGDEFPDAGPPRL
jgi:myo-inositol 2-dehydrogenase / D-chiro-inositol 1-dehydrogenase